MWNALEIFVWKLINITIFGLDNLVSVQSAVSWSDPNCILQTWIAIWWAKAIFEVSGSNISWANIIACWIATKADCTISQGVQKVFFDSQLSLLMIISCINQFVFNNSWSIFDCHLCVILCIFNIVLKLCRNISLLIWR